MKAKMKGFTEIQGVLLCVLMGLAAVSFLQIHSGQIAALAASRKGIQAQQYAQSTADLLRNTSYDKLDDAAHTKQAIANGNGWMSEVSIGAETTVNEVPQRMATVKVYRNSTVTAPDYSLQVPLSSAGGGKNKGNKFFFDYNNPIIIPRRTTFTAPKDGVVIVYDTICYAIGDVVINRKVAHDHYRINNNIYISLSGDDYAMWPLQKGDTYYEHEFEGVFLPFKE